VTFDPPPFTLLLGAESLLGRRTGVGRMTLQIARTVRNDNRLAGCKLLLGTRAGPVELIDTLREDTDTGLPRADSPLRRALRRVPGLIRLREQVLKRQLAAELRGLAASSAGRILYHEPNMIARPFDGPTVVTINDLSWLIDPAFHPRDRIAWIERNLPRSLRQAGRIVAISAFTRDEIVRRLGIDAGRIDVVPLAPAPGFAPLGAEAAAPVLAAHDLADRGYVLSVSTLEPRKNFDGLLAAYLRLPAALRARTPLVIAGGSGWGAALKGADAQAALASGTLRLLGFVPDDALRVLLARAAAFAFVSHYEGFGLPVIEAMASDTPVIASNTTAVAEVAADAAATVDPADPAAIAAALQRVLEDPAEAARLRDAGRARAAAFTWEATAERLFATWRRTLSGP
jgi:alpha-1,3-rhamnosyl/mannosyltransferase